MIANNHDVYAAVAALCDELRQSDEPVWASRLDLALHSNGTAAEVLADLWLVLHKLRRSDTALRLQLQARIDELLDYIDRTLGPREFSDECKCLIVRRLNGIEAHQYAEMHLCEIMMNSETYHILYECPDTGCYWMKDTPGIMEDFRLRQVSPREAAESFIFT